MCLYERVSERVYLHTIYSKNLIFILEIERGGDNLIRLQRKNK